MHQEFNYLGGEKKEKLQEDKDKKEDKKKKALLRQALATSAMVVGVMTGVITLTPRGSGETLNMSAQQLALLEKIYVEVVEEDKTELNDILKDEGNQQILASLGEDVFLGWDKDRNVVYDLSEGIGKDRYDFEGLVFDYTYLGDVLPHVAAIAGDFKNGSINGLVNFVEYTSVNSKDYLNKWMKVSYADSRWDEAITICIRQYPEETNTQIDYVGSLNQKGYMEGLVDYRILVPNEYEDQIEQGQFELDQWGAIVDNELVHSENVAFWYDASKNRILLQFEYCSEGQSGSIPQLMSTTTNYVPLLSYLLNIASMDSDPERYVFHYDDYGPMPSSVNEIKEKSNAKYYGLDSSDNRNENSNENSNQKTDNVSDGNIRYSNDVTLNIDGISSLLKENTEELVVGESYYLKGNPYVFDYEGDQITMYSELDLREKGVTPDYRESAKVLEILTTSDETVIAKIEIWGQEYGILGCYLTKMQGDYYDYQKLGHCNYAERNLLMSKRKGDTVIYLDPNIIGGEFDESKLAMKLEDVVSLSEDEKLLIFYADEMYTSDGRRFQGFGIGGFRFLIEVHGEAG